MANNRFQIYCKKCLEYLSIAKYYPISWGCSKNIGNYMNEFFEKHDKNCFKEFNECDLQWGEGMYGFREENIDDEFITGQNILIRK